MAKTTKVNFASRCNFYENGVSFRIEGDDETTIIVESFKDGYTMVNFEPWMTIEDIAVIVAGCFEVTSDFPSKVLFALHNDTSSLEFKGIKFTFSGILITATFGCTVDGIVSEWQKAYKEKAEKKRQATSKWLNSSVGQEFIQKVNKEKEIRENIRSTISEMDSKLEIEFKDTKAEEAWKSYLALNSKDSYHQKIMAYASRFAKFMQALILSGQKFDDDTALASRYCNFDNLSGYYFQYAIEILIECWKYGDELQKIYDSGAILP